MSGFASFAITLCAIIGGILFAVFCVGAVFGLIANSAQKQREYQVNHPTKGIEQK